MYEQYAKSCEEVTDWRALASPGLVSIADDCASCGVDLDVSCLDTLDEQLILSPVDCFTELCWAAAVQDDVTAPIVRRNIRSRARSFKGGRQPAFSPPPARDYPGSFERPRPLATKISLPLDAYRSYPSSPLAAKHDTSLTYSEKPTYILDADPPAQDISMPRPLKKRDLVLTPSVDAFAPSRPLPTLRLKTSTSSHTLRVIADACSLTKTHRRK
jgi:hypothetical protein